MNDWRNLMRHQQFEEAVPLVEAEYQRGDDYGYYVVNRAYFYETWASHLESDNPLKALEYYREADRDYAQFASWATSGGEGTARMLDVNRIRGKIEELEARL